jgi:hypothetical protein
MGFVDDPVTVTRRAGIDDQDAASPLDRLVEETLWL